MKKKIIYNCCILLFSVTLTPLQAQTTVFITPYSKTYHTQGCTYLDFGNVTALSLDGAKAEGYKPCSNCYNVFVIPNSTKFHLKGCSYLDVDKVTALSLDEAYSKGYKPCSNCYIMNAKEMDRANQKKAVDSTNKADTNSAKNVDVSERETENANPPTYKDEENPEKEPKKKKLF